MKKIKLYTLALAISMLGTSCEKWLNIKPDDKFLEEQIFSSEEAVEEVVNGFYLKMGNANLYRQTLTMTILDVLAQRYTISATTHPFYNYANYKYDQESVKNRIASIWTNSYATIANINNFLSVFPKNNTNFNTDFNNKMIGQSLGLRAFLHFDLLRMFGPIYNSNTKDLEAIPFYDELKISPEKFLTSEEIIVRILADLDEAERLLLSSDPIVKSSGNAADENNNIYFNYYAVQALKARVYQWIGNKDKALEAAEIVIQAQNKFPWVSHQAIASDFANPDRKFFSETIFNVFNAELYNGIRTIFSENVTEANILSTGNSNKVAFVYDDNQSDYRYLYSWPLPSAGVPFRVFAKYNDITDTNKKSRFQIPLIRISEMYYIAAESTSDQNKALTYLNTVRQHRNLINNITSYPQLRSELTKEYQKEFWGEGQLWFYYKRNEMTNITSMTSTTNIQNIPLHVYRFDIPEDEYIGR